MSLGLYIHIPFCHRRCSYCDFYLTTNMNLVDSFAEAIGKEIRHYSQVLQKECVDSIYFGGGTPSAVEANVITKILLQIFENFNLSNNPEITIECNPEDVLGEKDKFRKISKAGVNRISIGIQSFIDKELKYLTRCHNAIEAEESINILQDLFDNVNIDLIYALHNQSAEDIEYNLSKISHFNVNHVSAYTLIIEKGTLLHKQMEKSDKISLSAKKAEAYYFLISNGLKSLGYKQYEVSNYAKKGYESNHNLKYWNFENYLGLGPSAHSFINYKRFANVSSINRYNKLLKENQIPVETEIISNKKQLLNDYFISVFRSKGVDIKNFSKIFNEDFITKYKKEVNELINLNLAELSETHYYLTLKGYALADEITLKFIK